MSSEKTDTAEVPLQVGALLRFALEEVRTRIYEGVHAAGFRDVSQAQVTLFRWPGPDGRRPSEVAADAQISKQHVNDLLRGLEQAGYLRLERDGTDRRARIIRLTKRGRRLHDTALRIHDQVEDDWAAAVGRRRYDHLRATLAELTATRS
jgi:DNA-binding MarR family transcriptional regulator